MEGGEPVALPLTAGSSEHSEELLHGVEQQDIPEALPLVSESTNEMVVPAAY